MHGKSYESIDNKPEAQQSFDDHKKEGADRKEREDD
jgi:hypothetical protein